jgi:transposase-like protein
MRELFLRELRRRGNVSDAAKKAGVDRTTPYRWREAEPEFAASWDEALDAAIDAAIGKEAK